MSYTQTVTQHTCNRHKSRKALVPSFIDTSFHWHNRYAIEVLPTHFQQPYPTPCISSSPTASLVGQVFGICNSQWAWALLIPTKYTLIIAYNTVQPVNYWYQWNRGNSRYQFAWTLCWRYPKETEKARKRRHLMIGQAFIWRIVIGCR